MRELPPGKWPVDPQPADKPAEGWWPDPTDSLLVRYHDGTRWTDRTAPASLPRPGRRKTHVRYQLRQSFRRHVTGDRIWGASVIGLVYLMFTLYFSDEPVLGWLAMATLCAVLAGPLVVSLLPSSWQEFQDSGGHRAGGLIFCAVIIEAVLVRFVVVLPVEGLVFSWLNRITVFGALALLLGWASVGFRTRVARPDGTYRHLWVFGVIALVFLAAFLFFWRVRILDAFGLR
jgi:Protein of unknown function (DUF2510)